MMSSINRLEHYRNRYTQLIPSWQHATARYQALITKSINPHFKILDLGCGRGGVVERLGSTGNWLGVDPDRHSLKMHRCPILVRSCADAKALPIARNSFDMVISSWVMEHLSEPGWTFKEIARVLRPGGHFFFLTPNALHPIPRISQKMANSQMTQRILVKQLYNRLSVDTFPVQYLANTWQKIDQYATQVGLRLVEVELVDDPSYLAWDPFTFYLSIIVGRLLPAIWNIHIVGHYVLFPEQT